MVIIEGAGSPAEPNLREGDIANMGFAEAADVPVWLVGDIDCGGVFASLTGSLDILSASEQQRVKAFLINRFRGNMALLDDALIWLEKKTNRPVAGIIPYLSLELPEEDSPFRHISGSSNDNAQLNIAVIAYPRLSNHDDIDPLASEAGVNLRLVRSVDELQPADLIILPGSKHVASDLKWLHDNGFVPVLKKHLRYGGKLLGICGGMQMLGSSISDDGIEGGSATGLRWLPLSTTMEVEKTLRQVDQPAPAFGNHRVTGYEIHHGRSTGKKESVDLFPFAACSGGTQIWGTYVHGLFEQGEFRKSWLNKIGFTGSDGKDQHKRTMASLDLLADSLESVIKPELLAPLLQRKMVA
jgi:adenosylcobyric acid synthase